MRVQIASITCKHGTSLYAGGSRAELMEKLAKYCRENDDSELLDHSLPDEELFQAYFELENYGANEWVEWDTTEEVLVDITDLVQLFASQGGLVTEVDAFGVHTELSPIIQQAVALIRPNYEDAARAAGWNPLPDVGNGILWTRPEQLCDSANDDGAPTVESAEEACEFDHIELLPAPTRFYAISDEMADSLTDDERVVRDFAGFNVWARVER